MASFLEIFDLAAGTARTLLKTDRHIEAPNWSPDGRTIFVNGDGRLYRLDMDRPILQLVDTGNLSNLNNDHGISPDGRTLVFSDKTATSDSCIYTLPVAGGAPTRVTDAVPSWWHGWSPDGRRLAYTAVRDGTFAIVTSRLDGSDETIVIAGDHHYDGPDYSSDGNWIWFNSDRDGVMRLWRVRPDGLDVERMTDDPGSDWFPHPSPDGRRIVYLSYAPGTEGHPAGRDVTLNLLDLGTGSIRRLAAIFGGQGSLNVPCWAPDSRRFAYMRYARPSVT